jgi:putative PEP-CTERM system histidine kinase
VFHTMSMSIIGGYLIVMALTAYGLRLVGGDWGRLFQITFLFATIILGSIVMLLPRYRAMLRVQISKHFFAYRYDYRTEWLRFIQTVSGVDADKGRLPERVVEAVCTVIDSPGGALFAPGDDDKFDVLAQWNYKGFVPSAVAIDSDLTTFLTVRQRIVDLDELRDGEGDYGDLAVPAWAAGDRRAWLIVPLLYLDALKGFIVIERTVVARTLNWEDFELLRTLGRQSASYIAEASTQAELDEAGKFDEFNRRFAFIMHDIKNLVSGLSLVARNAERHADNPAFRADMVATLQGSVGKMNDLLARLAQRTSGRTEHGEAVDLALLLAEIVSVKSRQHAALELTPGKEQLFVTADPIRLEQLFGHLIQNAIEASKPGAAIEVDLRQDEAMAVIEIADHGTGMSPAFIRNELFKPFRSTKTGGFGIGAYEAREIVRSAGGRLDVTSREGDGSVFTIRLPLALLIRSSQARPGVVSPMRITA